MPFNKNLSTAYQYRARKKITISNSITSTTLSSFKVLVRLQDNLLKNRVNGGLVYNNNGYDIRVMNTSLNTFYSHEIEYYNPVTGDLSLWFSGTVSSSSNTEFYLVFSNPFITTSQENSASVFSGYNAVYHMDEASGNRNSAINTLPLTPIGAPTNSNTDGYTKGALVLTSGKNLYSTHNSLFRPGINFQYEAWVKITTNTGLFHPIVTKDGGYSGDGEITLDVESDLKPFIRYSFGHDQGEFEQAKSGNTISLGTWHYLVGNCDGTYLRIFMDGVLKATTGSLDTRLINDGAYFRIGFRDNRQLLGSIDEVRVGTKKTDEWNLAHYRQMALHSSYFSYSNTEVFRDGGSFLLNFV